MRTYFDTQLEMMRYYEILPKQYEIIDQITDDKISTERYTEIIGEVLQVNNSPFRTRKDEDETNGEMKRGRFMAKMATRRALGGGGV